MMPSTQSSIAIAEVVEPVPERAASFWRDAVRRYRRNRLAVAGLIVVVVIIALAAGANFYLIADQPRAFLFELLDRSREIVDGNGNVVQPFAAFGNEASDGRIRRRGFQQLDARLAHRHHADAYLLVLD